LLNVKIFENNHALIKEENIKIEEERKAGEVLNLLQRFV